jgi:ketosteroid isomerase-like protein
VKKFELQEIDRVLADKYARGEEQFRIGDMSGAVRDLYTVDACYLTPQLRLLRGRDAICEFFEAIKTEIGEVKVCPLCLWGDSAGVVYQLCNTVRRAPRGGAISHAHYLAAFRQVGDDWLCEMEVVAPGHIDVTSTTHYLAAIRS